ncbi:hypothetical protein V1478_001599 [Vespula squamosa]|uniref:Uncharacterized protein n=1 Tax=Vespula squamosa TaxID=30214 RepID=A0ABD2C1W2_VESSQ
MGQVSAANEEVYYIPHYVVIKESSVTTKLRVVFDISAKYNTKVSRNDTLKMGPNTQDGIYKLILRFRHPKRFISKKMLTVYQLNIVIYRILATLFLATRCLKQLTDDEKSFPRVVAMLKNDFL